MKGIKNRGAFTKVDYIMPFLLAAFVIVYPFVSALTVTDLTGELARLVPSGGRSYANVFSCAKEIFLLCFAVLGILVFIGERLFRDVPPKTPLKALPRLYWAALLGFVAFAALSCVLSRHKEVVLWGFPTDTEGLIAYLCYVVLFCLAYNYAEVLKSREVLSTAMLVLGGIVVALALFEHFVTPLSSLLYNIVDDRSGVALLLGNSTLFGTLCILLLPVVAVRSVKNWKLAPITGGLVFCVVVSASTAAFYAMLAELVLVAVVAALKKVPPKRLLAGAGVAVGVVVALAVVSGTFAGYLGSVATSGGAYSVSETDIFPLTGIDMKGKELTFHSNDISLTAENDLGAFRFYDTAGKPLTPKAQEDGFTFAESDYSAVKVTQLDTVLVFDFGYADTIEFDTLYDDFNYVGINGYLYPEITESGIPPKWQRYYSFATGRGYIWLNTLPIAKECLLVGKGAGNFSFYFPQNNVVESLNVHGTSALLTDKPHNLYLQLVVSFGVPALAAFLVLAVAAIGKSGKKVIQADDVPIECGFAVGAIAFMVCALVNDSSVATSPFFWIYLGYLEGGGDDGIKRGKRDRRNRKCVAGLEG